MPKVGETRKQLKRPGSGWDLLRSEKKNGKVIVNVWVYRGTGAGDGSGGGGGGGGGTGGGTGGGGGGGESAEDKKKKRQRYIDAYNNFMTPTGKQKFTPPKRMLDLAVENDWSLSTMYTWIRQNDPNYLETDQAKSLISNFRTMLKDIFGPTFTLKKKTDKGLYNAMIDYAKLPPGQAKNKTTLMNVFANKIITSKRFKKMFPLFNLWFKSKDAAAAGVFSGLTNPGDFIAEYQKRIQLYTAAFKETDLGIGDPEAVIPPALLMEAMSKGWSVDGIEWKTAVRKTREYFTSAGAESRQWEFINNWNRMFQGTEFEDTGPDGTLLDAYIRGTMDFTTFFNQVWYKPGTATAAMIDKAFPSYAGFLKNNPQYMSGELDLFGNGGYFDRRLELIEAYKALISDPDAVPPAELLDRALAGAWSTTQWQLYVRENDPAYSTSPSGEARIGSLERYWDALFGQDALIDPEIERKWLAGEMTSPEDLLRDIQELDIFKRNYPHYEAFQKKQVDIGGGPSADPALYKEYEAAWTEAFQNAGLDPEMFGQLKYQYFSSGVDSKAFGANMAQWASQKNIFKITTGQEADMTTAAGIATPEQGGAIAGSNLRKRMEQELEKYRNALSAGRAQRPVEKERGNITQVI